MITLGKSVISHTDLVFPFYMCFKALFIILFWLLGIISPETLSTVSGLTGLNCSQMSSLNIPSIQLISNYKPIPLLITRSGLWPFQPILLYKIGFKGHFKKSHHMELWRSNNKKINFSHPLPNDEWPKFGPEDMSSWICLSSSVHITPVIPP